MGMDKRPHKERYDSGLKARTEALGRGWGEQSLAGVAACNRAFTYLLSTDCSTDLESPPGLSHKLRSVVNLGMLIALGTEHELKLHLRRARNNGLTKEEIKEVLLQTAIYCGVPAAVVAFRCAKEVLQSG